MRKRKKQHVVIAEVFGVELDAEYIKHLKTLKADLGRTRTEQVLLRLFAPDALENHSDEDLENVVRDCKRRCLRFTKWSSLFAPIYTRACEAMSMA